MIGSRDAFIGHRGFWHECKYWYRSTFGKSVPTEDMVYQMTPSGVFYADEVGEYIYGDNRLGAMVFNNNRVNIKTRDDVQLLKKNDLVFYHDRIWRVDDVRKRRIRKREQVCEEYDLYETTLSLVRG